MASFDWELTKDEAKFQALEAFEQLVTSGETGDAKKYETRANRAFALAKRNRTDPRPLFLSGMRNWASKEGVLFLQGAGKKSVRRGNPIPLEVLTKFKQDLRDEIEARIAEILLDWQEQDLALAERLQKALGQQATWLENRDERAFERESQDYKHLQTMRGYMVQDQKVSSLDTIVRTGKNAGCLLGVVALLAMGILVACFFAFHP